MRTLVIYVFHQLNSRVEYFIQHAIFEHPDVDFFVVCNNKETQLKLPTYVKYMNRDNKGFDFGGWSDAILTDNLYQQYDTFIFANSSIMGPYLPNGYTGKWTDLYINELNKNNVKLFGSTINCNDKYEKCDMMRTPHIQSYIFCTDKEALEYLISKRIFSLTNYAENMEHAIMLKEVLMSRFIIANNWNIGCMFRYYKNHNIDFRFKDKSPSDYKVAFLGDIMCIQNKEKFGDFSEFVFVKGNRLKMP